MDLTQVAINKNSTTLAFSRATLAIFCGLIAGLLKLESLYGFAFYVCYSILFTILLARRLDKFGFQVEFGGIWGDLPSFILFWVFAYGIMYVYE